MWLEDFLAQSTVNWPDREALQRLSSSPSGINRRAYEQVVAALSGVGAVIIAASEGRGKTTLARYVAFLRHQKEDENVWYLDLGKCSDDEVQETVHQLKQGQPRLYVVENVHVDPDAIDNIVNARMASRHSKYIFTDRQVGASSVRLNRPSKKVFLKPTDEDVRRIIDFWIRTHRNLNLSPISDAELPGLIARTGGNLRVLAAYLEAWKLGPLSAVDQIHVLDHVWEHRFARLAAAEQIILVRVSAVAQFDVPFEPSGLDEDSLEHLCQEGLIRALPQSLGFQYETPHPTDAELNVQAWAARAGSTASAITGEVLRWYLSSGAPAAPVLGQVRRRNYRLLQELLQEGPVIAAFMNSVCGEILKYPFAYLAKYLLA